MKMGNPEEKVEVCYFFSLCIVLCPWNVRCVADWRFCTWDSSNPTEPLKFIMKEEPKSQIQDIHTFNLNYNSCPFSENN